jgi:hypothetical protein
MPAPFRSIFCLSRTAQVFLNLGNCAPRMRLAIAAALVNKLVEARQHNQVRRAMASLGEV